MPTEQDEFTSVTITFKMTPEQRAAYALDYPKDNVEQDLPGYLRAAVSTLLYRSTFIARYTTCSVSDPS